MNLYHDTKFSVVFAENLPSDVFDPIHWIGFDRFGKIIYGWRCKQFGETFGEFQIEIYKCCLLLEKVTKIKTFKFDAHLLLYLTMEFDFKTQTLACLFSYLPEDGKKFSDFYPEDDVEGQAVHGSRYRYICNSYYYSSFSVSPFEQETDKAKFYFFLYDLSEDEIVEIGDVLCSGISCYHFLLACDDSRNWLLVSQKVNRVENVFRVFTILRCNNNGGESEYRLDLLSEVDFKKSFNANNSDDEYYVDYRVITFANGRNLYVYPRFEENFRKLVSFDLSTGETRVLSDIPFHDSVTKKIVTLDFFSDSRDVYRLSSFFYFENSDSVQIYRLNKNDGNWTAVNVVGRNLFFGSRFEPVMGLCFQGCKFVVATYKRLENGNFEQTFSVTSTSQVRSLKDLAFCRLRNSFTEASDTEIYNKLLSLPMSLDLKKQYIGRRAS